MAIFEHCPFVALPVPLAFGNRARSVNCDRATTLSKQRATNARHSHAESNRCGGLVAIIAAV